MIDDPYGNNANNAPAFDFDHSMLDDKNRYNPVNNYKLEIDSVVSYKETRQLNPGGVKVYALTNYGTPPFNPIGNAFFTQRMPAPCEPAVQVITQSDVNTMLGGLITGQNISQPLFDPASDTYGGFNL
jgi:hypothetical protein